MSTAIKARTARKPHRCEGCRRTTIAPGHRYLRHTLFPDGINTTGKPWTSLQCVACLAERDPAGPLLTAGACSTFCCGVVPCARPLDHNGDHSCQRCIDLPAPAAVHLATQPA